MTATETETAEPIQSVRHTYVAVQRLLSHHNGKHVYREVGDEMPEVEAWDWTIRESYLRNHRIEKVTVGSTEPPKRKPGRPPKDASR